ncbi:hypothetical protein [Blastococcus goldschmidtiae]|uniref:Secreted protein n=1 Tax=Blastococcus goldschmidtiae TaxID=3075546 RepID=A0ABU2K7A4_9ACTN|nr:hypothetical protein [Blastococcus sp. DSM 46792]MDT0276086.1 hypothetical protein [Blastococcus sp. DSM 46792]
MVKSLLVAALFAGGVAVPAGVAQAHTGDEGGTPAGIGSMHELMEQGNPGMAQMHELMQEGNPGMTEMCERMHQSAPDHA